MDRLSEFTRVLREIRGSWAAVATLLFGLAVTLTVWAALHAADEHQLATEFSHRAAERAEAIEFELDSVIDHVRLLAAALEVNGPPTSAEFERLATALLHDDSALRALSFNPVIERDARAAHEAAMRAAGHVGYTISERDAHGELVPAADRGRYVVIQHIVPIASNAGAIGFDISSVDDRREALGRAWSTGRIQSTGAVDLVQQPGGKTALLVVEPIPASTPVLLDGTAPPVVAFGVGVVSVEHLGAAALAPLRPAGIDLELIDLDAPPQRRTVHRHRSRRRVGDPAADTVSRRLQVQSHEFSLAGRRWRVDATPTDEWDRLGGVAPLVALSIGLLATVLIAGYMRRLTIVDRRLRREIVQRERAEEKLTGFGRILDESNEELYVVDAEWLRFLHVNRGARRNLGYSMDELRGMGPLDLVPPSEGRRIRELLDPANPGHGSRVTIESSHRRKDGTAYLVEVHAERTRFDGREAIVAVVIDVTERRRVEDRLRQSQRIEALGTLAGGIAHDINNLLTAIMGYTDLAHEDARPGSPQSRNLEEVTRAAELARDVVRRILTFSRQESGRREPVELRRLLEESLRLVRTSLPASVDVEQRFSCETCYIEADSTQLRQVLMNLLTNAGHAMQERGGRLTVALACDRPGEGGSPRARILVRDTGCGIASDVVDRIFDPFFTTKGPGDGSGMGLAVAHGIVAAHGGTIEVASEPGRGSTFEVVLPSVADGARVARAEPADAARASRERVLLVDDDRAVLDVTAQLLRGAGFVVDPWDDPQAAVERVRADPRRFDLVVTDYRMPRLDGLELAARVSRSAPRLPVVLISGYGELIDPARIAAGSVRRVLAKPLHGEELAAALRAVLGEPQPADAIGSSS